MRANSTRPRASENTCIRKNTQKHTHNTHTQHDEVMYPYFHKDGIHNPCTKHASTAVSPIRHFSMIAASCGSHLELKTSSIVFAMICTSCAGGLYLRKKGSGDQELLSHSLSLTHTHSHDSLITCAHAIIPGWTSTNHVLMQSIHVGLDDSCRWFVTQQNFSQSAPSCHFCVGKKQTHIIAFLKVCNTSSLNCSGDKMCPDSIRVFTVLYQPIKTHYSHHLLVSFRSIVAVLWLHSFDKTSRYILKNAKKASLPYHDRRLCASAAFITYVCKNWLWSFACCKQHGGEIVWRLAAYTWNSLYDHKYPAFETYLQPIVLVVALNDMHTSA